MHQKKQCSPISVNAESSGWTGCENWLVVVVIVIEIVVVLISVGVHDTEDGHDVTGTEADIIIAPANEGVVGQEVRGHGGSGPGCAHSGPRVGLHSLEDCSKMLHSQTYQIETVVVTHCKLLNADTKANYKRYKLHNMYDCQK